MPTDLPHNGDLIPLPTTLQHEGTPPNLPHGTPPRRRYVLVTNGLARGGAETQTVRLGVELAGRGHSVKLLSILPTQAFSDEVREAGIEIKELHGHLQPGLTAVVPVSVRAGRTLRRWRPEVIVSFVYQANILARLLRWCAPGAVVVSSVRNENFGGWRRDLTLRLTDRLAEATTTNSQRSADRLAAAKLVRSDRLHVIANSVDAALLDPATSTDGSTAVDRAASRRELGVGPDAFFWLAIGRLAPQKNFTSLIDALVVSSDDDDDAAHLAIVGEGPLHAVLASQVAAHGLSKRVQLLGERSDVPALLAAADGLVLSSSWEGLPNVVMEAMAAGLPVVATDVGGVRELVDERNGLVVPPDDSASLSAAMRTIESLAPKALLELGEAARGRIALDYQVSVIVDRWETLVEGLLTRRRSEAAQR